MSENDDEFARALERDGEKLRQLTGQDHGPQWACAGCGKISPDRWRNCDCTTDVLIEKPWRGKTVTAWKISEMTLLRERFDTFSRDALLRRIRDQEIELDAFRRSAFPHLKNETER